MLAFSYTLYDEGRSPKASDFHDPIGPIGGLQNNEEVKAMAFDVRVQAVPLGYEGVSFQVDGAELTRYNTGRGVWRPYLFPLIGPSGRMLTRVQPRSTRSKERGEVRQ